MISETRRIDFDPPDLEDALVSYRRVNADFLPAGDVKVQAIGRDGSLRAAVRMTYGKVKQDAEIHIDAAEMLLVLIRACCEINIPIPRRGKKSIAANDRGLSLLITVTPNADNVPETNIERASA